MCGSHLKIEREDIDPEDTGKYFDPMHSTSAELLKYVMHCEADGYFQMAIAHKVQALLLTRQLTNLAGNSWSVRCSLPPVSPADTGAGTRRCRVTVPSATSSFSCIASPSADLSVPTRSPQS